MRKMSIVFTIFTYNRHGFILKSPLDNGMASTPVALRNS